MWAGLIIAMALSSLLGFAVSNGVDFNDIIFGFVGFYFGWTVDDWKQIWRAYKRGKKKVETNEFKIPSSIFGDINAIAFYSMEMKVGQFFILHDEKWGKNVAWTLNKVFTERKFITKYKKIYFDGEFQTGKYYLEIWRIE